MRLDTPTANLVAIGASVSANCLPCLEINVERAVKSGVDGDEIAEAIEVGRMVRKGAASKLDKLAAEFTRNAPAMEIPPGACGCRS